MRLIKILMLLSSLVVLSGCGWLYGEDGLIKDNEYTYLKSQIGESLIMPKGISGIQIVDEFPVPELAAANLDYSEGMDLSKTAPTLILAVDSSSGVYTRDKRYAPTVWFRIKEIEIWQALVDYLVKNEVPLQQKEIGNGVIETDWIELDQSSFFANLFGSDEIRALRFKYRFTLFQSPKRNLQLLSVQNFASQSVRYGDDWFDDDTSRIRAIKFMNDFLGTWSQYREKEARKRVLLANKGIQLELGHDNNDNPAMMAQADFLQSWERLASVLISLGFEIEDKDQTLGIYFVKYDGVESSSFFEVIKFWKSSDNNTLQLAEGDYQINLSALSERTAITLSNKEGSVISAEVLNKIYPDFAEEFSNRVESRFR